MLAENAAQVKNTEKGGARHLRRTEHAVVECSDGFAGVVSPHQAFANEDADAANRFIQPGDRWRFPAGSGMRMD